MAQVKVFKATVTFDWELTSEDGVTTEEEVRQRVLESLASGEFDPDDLDLTITYAEEEWPDVDTPG